MNENVLMLLLYTAYGSIVGMSIMYGIARKRTVRAVRKRFLKITETYSLAIHDFAGKNVSLERFCDRVFGPEAFVVTDKHTRKHNRLMFIVMSIFVTILMVAVTAAVISN